MQQKLYNLKNKGFFYDYYNCISSKASILKGLSKKHKDYLNSILQWCMVDVVEN